MVSKPIDVLPVWRSPTINSLWPRPIGIIESIAITPVCKGSNTDCLSIIPGAGDSITHEYWASTRLEAKLYIPSGSKIEPIEKSPSIIEANRDKPIIFPPSETRLDGLNNKAPMIN